MRCEVTNWQVVGEDLARQLEYFSDAGEDLCTIQIRLTLTIGGTGEIETRFCIVYAPAVSRAPETYCAMQITPLARLTDGPFVNARVTCSGPVNKFWVEDAEEAANIMEVLWAGEELRWLVLDGSMKSVLEMRVPHDTSFRTALTEMQAQVRGRAIR
jgi:hypothetical protein